MNEAADKLKSDGYVVLTNLLQDDACEKLTQHMFDLKEKGLLQTDEQCGKSYSIYASPPFEKLLDELTQPLSDAVGIKLLPTYSYARIYKKGEVLKIHQDRPACEISATLTLGFSGDKVWPIYMSKTESDGKELLLNVGDLCVYKGGDMYHWRDELEHDWQVQVFLHYVDGHGPNKDCIYDNRGKLNIDNTVVKKDMGECYFWYFNDALTHEQCDNYIEQYSKEQLIPGLIGSEEDSNSSLNLDIRNVNKMFLPLYKGLSAQMVGASMVANQQVWNYSITNVSQSEYLKYDVSGKYEAHMDTFISNKPSEETRKLTCLAFLNDDFEGGKLYLIVGSNKIYPPQEKGNMIVFPSFIVHGVEPITKGIRHSVVTWIQGPSFK